MQTADGANKIRTNEGEGKRRSETEQEIVVRKADRQSAADREIAMRKTDGQSATDREIAVQGKKQVRERDMNADLIRCVAVFSVLSVHFLLNSGFYNEPTNRPDILLLCVYRAFFMSCVPLFMILTGYLMLNKTLSRRYYKGLWKTIEIYLLASIACLLFKKFALNQAVTWKSAILDILDFDAANYAWYIEMYIGLFLMIPFLNLAYHGLKNQREKQILVLTMMAITMLPKLLNIFDLRTPGWWAAPSVSKKYDPIVPAFFTTMYPITYYFIGAYLKEYGLKLKKRLNIALLIVVIVVFGWYNYYRSDGGSFVWGGNSTWGGENLITAVLLFTLLLHLNVKRWPVIVRELLTYISGISLGLYLISWIFDRIVYDGILNAYVPVVAERWKFWPLVVPSVFLMSAAGSSLMSAIRYGLHAIVRKLRGASSGRNS